MKQFPDIGKFVKIVSPGENIIFLMGDNPVFSRILTILNMEKSAADYLFSYVSLI